MDLGIRRYADVEVADRLQARDELRGMRKAVWMRGVWRGTRRQIAAQSHQVPNSHVPVLTRDIENFAARCSDARQMRRSDELRLPLDARHDAVGSCAC